MNMERFQERVAIITGGGGRIGSATAQRLASEGAKVVCADLIKEAAEAAAHEIGGDAIGLSFDAAAANSVEGLIRKTVSHFGRLDVLNKNALVTKLGDLDTEDRKCDVSGKGESVRVGLGGWRKNKKT